MEDAFSQESYDAARDILEQAGIVRKRAKLLLDSEDYSGSVEASQHTVELTIKALFKMTNLDIPKIHDPGNELDKVIQKIKSLFTEVDSSFFVLFSRFKFISNLLARLHIQGMYGIDNVPSHRIFGKKDAEYFWWCALEVWIVSKTMFLFFGYNLGLANDEEREICEDFIKAYNSFNKKFRITE